MTAQPDAWDGQTRADITYQLLVYSFADSDGNGIGDFNGITSKLDYLKSLGVNALWLSPIHPAMSYHGYDVTDYTKVNPQYGTEADFDNLVAKAHAAGIKIYLDYVMNHTGKNHEWFKSASSDVNSPYRSYYTFSQDPEGDIKAGKFPAVDGYNSGEWYTVGNAEAVSGIYKFVLNWKDKTITVTKASKADSDNPDQSTSNAKYLYFGDGVCKKFYDKGNDTYELTVNLNTTWGFLIRTSNTSWDSGTKFGASSSSSKVTLGKAFKLDSNTASDIKFDFMDAWYYHAMFYTDMPDLDYGKVSDVRSNATYKAMLSAAEGWVDRGVDGFRLDAVKHIYHNATNDDNPQFLKTFYEDMNAYYRKSHSEDLYMIGEVLDSYTVTAPYYKGLPALFDFTYWYSLESMINGYKGNTLAYEVLQHQQKFASYRSDYLYTPKLSNHDEDRAASKLGKSLPKEKLAAAILLTTGGHPYIYYGEELGIYGTKNNGDEYVRSPMLWGDNTVTSYTSKIDKGVANSIKSAADQAADANSLLSTYRTYTALRNTYPALATGKMTRHDTYNETNTSLAGLAAWYMTEGSQKLLVLHNLSNATIQVPLTESVNKAIAMTGEVKQQENYSKLQMPACSSIVLLLK